MQLERKNRSSVSVPAPSLPPLCTLSPPVSCFPRTTVHCALSLFPMCKRTTATNGKRTREKRERCRQQRAKQSLRFLYFSFFLSFCFHDQKKKKEKPTAFKKKRRSKEEEMRRGHSTNRAHKKKKREGNISLSSRFPLSLSPSLPLPQKNLFTCRSRWAGWRCCR
jgi:hypothetical protein